MDAEERADLVDLDDLPVCIGRRVYDRTRHRRDAGVAHEDVEPAEPVDRGRDRGGPVVLAGHVEVAVHTGVAELARYGMPLLVEHVAENDARASFRQEPCLGRALAAGGARHQRNLPVERVLAHTTVSGT